MALRCVEATARLGSMTLAADHLHLTHGAVSRHVRNVERLLGQQLFERGARRLLPTPACRQLADDIDRALADLQRAFASARDAGAHRTLTLSCEPTLLTRWLIPRVSGFQHPDSTALKLVAAGGPVRFHRDGIDLAIRRDDFPRPQGILAQELITELVGPVCTPSLGAELSTPADLQRQVLLHTRTRPDAWQRWLENHKITIADQRSQTFEHFYIALEAATAGIGVAVASRLMVVDALASGVLVAPFGFVPDGSRYELLSETEIEPESELAPLRDFLLTLAHEDLQHRGSTLAEHR